MEKNNAKVEKEKRLLQTAFKLFTEKGINNTSVQDIVDDANVAKGTFYLYFKDKYELRDVLIAKTSKKLFDKALKSLDKNRIDSFEDQIIYIINYVIDELTKKTIILKFISNNLSFGFYNKSITKICEIKDNNDNKLLELFLQGIQENHIQLKNPEITLFMIIELVSSTCFHTILYKEPLSINEFKPYLYQTIKNMLKEEKKMEH